MSSRRRSTEGYLVGAPAFAQAGLERLPADQPIIVGMRAPGTLTFPASGG